MTAENSLEIFGMFFRPEISCRKNKFYCFYTFSDNPQVRFRAQFFVKDHVLDGDSIKIKKYFYTSTVELNPKNTFPITKEDMEASVTNFFEELIQYHIMAKLSDDIK